MNCALIACKMMEKELAKPLEAWNDPVIWMERSLHNSPNRLRDALQETIDDLDPTIDTVLLAFGFCGTALDGVGSATRRLILPLCDDCITMLLTEERNPCAMYYTDGWFVDRQFLGKEYAAFAKKMGEDAAKDIYKQILCAYQEFCLMDTGAYDLAEAAPMMEQLSQTFSLPWRTVSASTSYLEDLLSHHWDASRFWVLEPGHTFNLTDFLANRPR